MPKRLMQARVEATLEAQGRFQAQCIVEVACMQAHGEASSVCRGCVVSVGMQDACLQACGIEDALEGQWVGEGCGLHECVVSAPSTAGRRCRSVP